MQLTESHRQYWQKNLNITAVLLAVWFVVTFVVGFFARDLNFNFFGWPFSVWIASHLVWLNRDGLAFPGASTEAVFMQGAGGHLVWVDPGLDAVVVTRWLDPAHTGTFVKMAADALRQA